MLPRARSFPTDLRTSVVTESPYSRALTAISDGDSRKLLQALGDKQSKMLLQERGAGLLHIASEKGATGKKKYFTINIKINDSAGGDKPARTGRVDLHN